jgi:hypothetical protein
VGREVQVLFFGDFAFSSDSSDDTVAEHVSEIAD